MSEKRRVLAAPGWFTEDGGDGAPRLLGTRCTSCGNVFFPREETFCRNPGCVGTTFEEVPLSPRGRLWSFTNNCYPPPDPFVPPTDPFEPYAVAAVELEDEKMVVLGQVVAGVGTDQLEAGMEMELVVETLFEDEESQHVVWKWKPAGTEAA